jgi:hypothetical protein
MFERFTDRARRVLVLANDEAEAMHHEMLGTEHILLGLIDEGEGVAAKVLESLGVHLEHVRAAVAQRAQPSASPAAGPRPFTPRAKKVLELSLREALKLGHNYIGTEHLLLGLAAEGEGVAAHVLAELGVSAEKVRSAVLDTLSGYRPPEQAPRGGRREWAARGLSREPPVCGRCGSSLTASARYLDIAVQPAEGAKEGEQVSTVRLVYCSTCGVALGTSAGAVEGVAATLHKALSLAEGPSRPSVRPFPAEAAAPVKLEEVPEARRAELAWSDRRIVEGHVGGSDVQLLGQWGHQGSLEGAWAGEALTVSWRVEASGVSRAPAGELTGRFGERDVELRSSFQLSERWLFEAGEVSGNVGSDELQAKLAPATGGLGGHAVVAEGTLGAIEFEVFISLSGGHSRAAVRGTVAGHPARLDGEHLDGNGAVHLAGEYSGPAELLALVVSALFYFM